MTFKSLANTVCEKIARKDKNFREFRFSKGSIAVTRLEENNYSFNVNEKVCSLTKKELNEFANELKKL